ncbi:MAG: hypothetical protein ABR968_12585 [Bacteroidales bacterium]|jgi:hypothetical protein
MITQILDGLVKILGPIATLSKDKRELKDSALRAISNALTETYLYYNDLDRGGKRNRDREGLLFKYWSAAAIPIRHFDPSLAEKCDLKAEYWLNPENCPNNIKKLIKLDDVRRAYKKMLLPNYSITEHNSTKRKNREV